MSPPSIPTENGGASTGREGATRSGRNVQSAYMVKPSSNDSREKETKDEKPANWNATAPAPRKKGEKGSDAEDGTSTPGPNTPATTNSGGTPAKRPAEAPAEGEAPAKKQRATWSAEAVALGYETGTIKHAAYVLLAASGTAGMTVASIVESAQKQGLYSWGTCKTPNNSVTAALSQDTTFVRIAPSTYALRSSLRGGAAANAPVPQQRTSSGSTNSGAHAESARADSGSASGGAVAGGRSNGSNANSKARPEREGHDKPRVHGGGEFSGGYANALAQQLHQAGRVAGGKESQAKRLAMESYKRRMDVYAGQIGGPGDICDRDAFVFPEPTRPAHSPDAHSAGSCLFFYPTASQHVPPPKKPEPHKEPTEGLKRANSWKDEAKQNASDDLSGIERTASGHLPAWVLEQFKAESKNPIAAA